MDEFSAESMSGRIGGAKSYSLLKSVVVLLNAVSMFQKYNALLDLRLCDADGQVG